MSTYVAGVDPGLSTGLFVLLDGRRHHAYQGAATAMLEYLADLAERCTGSPNDKLLVAVERFTRGSGGSRHTVQDDARHVIGAVREIGDRCGVEVVLQSPAAAKSLVADRHLRELGLWVVPREVGAPDAADVRDAARHAVTLLATRCASVYERMLAEIGSPDGADVG